MLERVVAVIGTVVHAVDSASTAATARTDHHAWDLSVMGGMVP